MISQIVLLYAIGMIFFILGIEDDENITKNIIYLGMSFFINLMGYYLSYSDADYTLMAYMPLILLILTVLILIYNVWQLIPVSDNWGADAEDED